MNTLETSYGPYLAAVCARTAHALATCGYRSLLVHSGSLLTVFVDDRTYPFEVHAPFKVWAPLLDAPDCFVYFEPGQSPRLIFNSPVDYWYKPAALPQEYWTGHFDVRPVADLQAARDALPKDLSRTAYIGDPLAELAGWGVAAVNPPALSTRLDFDRAVKQPYELECLRQASRLGARGHRAALEAFRAGGTEFDIEIAFLKACGMREQELPYNPIIALNEAGAVLHYQMLERTSPRERRSLLIDAGGFALSAAGGEIPRPEGHPYLRLTRVLQEGFVVTMEPGIYFIDPLLNSARGDTRASRINWTRVEALKPYGGIRIEDDVAITATGCENLTRDAFAAVGTA